MPSSVSVGAGELSDAGGPYRASHYGRAGLDRNDRWRDCTLGGIDRVRAMMERFMT